MIDATHGCRGDATLALDVMCLWCLYRLHPTMTGKGVKLASAAAMVRLFVMIISCGHLLACFWYGIILDQNVNGPWGISAGLPGRNDLQVYITCLKHVLMSLLRSAANPGITTQASDDDHHVTFQAAKDHCCV